MTYQGNKDSGYIALITMLIAVFACTALVASSGWSVWSTQQISLLKENYAQARELAQSCARLGVQRVMQNQKYTGPETFNLPGGLTCIVNNTHLSSGFYTIDTEGVVNGSLVRLRTTVSATTFEVVARSQSP